MSYYNVTITPNLKNQKPTTYQVVGAAKLGVILYRIAKAAYLTYEDVTLHKQESAMAYYSGDTLLFRVKVDTMNKIPLAEAC